MIILTLDTEQAGIVFDTAMAAQSILSHRTARADPEGVITKSIALQRIKMEQILTQFSLPNRPNWAHLPTDRQREFRDMIGGFSRAETSDELQVLYAQIFAFYCKTRAILLDIEYDADGNPRPPKDQPSPKTKGD